MKKLARRTGLPCGAPVTISIQRNSLPPTLAPVPMMRPVVTVNPDATMVTPGPIARGPIPAHAVIVIPRPVVEIRAIADFDRESDRL